ncbi:MAG: hypothetical protein ACRDVF_17775 [Microbacterium sp.]|uniref:hypothetical protein n=1 Tax=Microbacterium sp. TaxID=51671 RepID=UPI003D6DBC33
MTSGEGGREGSPTRELASTVSAVAGAVAAAATLVIVPGGLALYLRLRAQDLPDDPGTVVSLPSQFLIGIGVGYLLIPLLIVGGLAVIVLLVPGGSDEPNPKLPAPRPLWGGDVWGRVVGWVATALILGAIGIAGKVPSLFFDSWPPWWVIGAAILLAVVVWILLSVLVAEQRRAPVKGLAESVPGIDLARHWREWNGFLLLAFVTALTVGLPFAIDSSPPWWSFVLSATTVTVWLAVSQPITRKYETRVFSLIGVAMTTLITILVFLPWGVAFAALRGEFPNATVCTSDGGRFDGVLIGETSDRVYVGEPNVEVVAFVPNELSESIDRLRNAGTAVTLEDDLEGVSFGRTDAVVVNLENRPFDLEDLVKAANAPELGFARSDKLRLEEPRAQAAGIDVTKSRNRVVTDLPALVDLLLRRDQGRRAQVTPKPGRRIASIPSNRVTQIFIGGSGNCPVLPSGGP